ncbi:MAG: hypothetical protein ACE5IY_10325 [bacterium]
METPIEQTLSKPTLQFGLRPVDYLVLVLVATLGSFFLSKLWLILIILVLFLVFRYVNKSKRRYFWSSIYIWLITNTHLHIKQTRKLPPLLNQ